MEQPLVSVICLCYNHARYVREAVESVLQQTYPAIQVIVVDDASKDDSVAVIRELVREYPNISFLPLPANLGNCKAFNKGLALAKGDYIIDFATDDVMTPERIVCQVELFNRLGPEYGVVFTDAVYIDPEGHPFRNHYEYLFRKGLLDHIPQGDVYSDLLSSYFIASPTMMVRMKVMEDLKGYDENLAYEDFDFWVRSARTYKYAFLNKRLTKIRRLKDSMSAHSYKPGDKQLFSTYLVCRKAMALNRSREDEASLATRVRYELRQAVFSDNYHEADLFYQLLSELQPLRWHDHLLHRLNKLRLPLSTLREKYLRMRFGVRH